MDTSKIIKGVVNSGRYTVTAPIMQEHYGIILKIEGAELPETYQVDFSNDEHRGTSVTMIGNADGVLIPRQFIDTGKDVFAFLYWVGENYGKTVYKFRIPNKCRPDRTSEEPTPEEQSTIDQAISALNEAVAQTAQDVIDAEASAQSASQSAENAHDSAVDAQNYAETAQTSANNASASASQASTSATASAQSASQSAQIKADVEDLADDAQGYAQASAQSASASANSASQAQGFAQSASASANSASGYASNAQSYSQTASAKAQDASQSATMASAKATESAQSASQALTYKNDAESAKTASQTAQGLAESARDSAITAKDDAESARDDAESARDEAQSAVASISGALAEKAPVITDTASGSIASFSDGADDLPLKSLVVDINPVQDLHGYDSPWPAAGGEQLIPYPYSQTGTTTINGITFDVIADGDIAISGTASANAQIDLCTNNYNTMPKLPAGDYTISVNNINVRAVVTIYDGDGHSTAEYGTPASRVFNIPNDGSDYRCRVLLRVLNSTAISGTAHIAIKLQNGNSATSWSPYENICPISGWTQVDVEQSGVNLVSKTISGYQINASGVISVNTNYDVQVGAVKTGESYTITNGDSNIVIAFYASEPSIDSAAYDGTRIVQTSHTFTAPINGFVAFRTNSGYSTPQLELGSTATPYSPYTGRSITINLGQTVYGGKLDVLSGGLTIDRAMVDLGTLDWITTDSGRHRTSGLSSAIKRIDNHELMLGACSSYKLVIGNAVANTDMSLGQINLTNILINDSRYNGDDATAFKNDMGGVQLVYELAEPIEIQLTPNQLNSLYGVNNIWADSGDTSAEYRADTKAWIQRKIAEALASLT